MLTWRRNKDQMNPFNISVTIKRSRDRQTIMVRGSAAFLVRKLLTKKFKKYYEFTENHLPSK